MFAVEDQPIPYLVMEYIDGETLQQKLDRTGPLDVAEVLRIGAQAARGLAAAHKQGLIHRDIKPANILLENGIKQRVRITDFGLARAADDASLTQSGLIAGTPLYMAPEQAEAKAIDQRADLFSLGSVLYVMVSGRPPFRAPTTLAVLKRVASDTPRPIREIVPEVPESSRKCPSGCATSLASCTPRTRTIGLLRQRKSPICWTAAWPRHKSPGLSPAEHPSSLLFCSKRNGTLEACPTGDAAGWWRRQGSRR